MTDPTNIEALKDETNQLFAEFRKKTMEAFSTEFQARPEVQVGGQTQIVFQIVYVTALMDSAAVIGIDSGMTKEMFVNIMKETYDRVYESTPKFG